MATEIVRRLELELHLELLHLLLILTMMMLHELMIDNIRSFNRRSSAVSHAMLNEHVRVEMRRVKHAIHAHQHHRVMKRVVKKRVYLFDRSILVLFAQCRELRFALSDHSLTRFISCLLQNII